MSPKYVNIPDGYEWTGEYRMAIKGEIYLHPVDGVWTCRGICTRNNYHILRKVESMSNIERVLITVPVPQGFELTGEYRLAKYGEWYFDGKQAYKWTATSESAHNYLILRKRKPVRAEKWVNIPLDRIYDSRNAARCQAESGWATIKIVTEDGVVVAAAPD